MENQPKIYTGSKINNLGTYTLALMVIVIIASGFAYWLHEKNRRYISASEYNRRNATSSYSNSITANALSTDGRLEH